MIAVTKEVKARRTCQKLSNLVELARASDAKIMQKTRDIPGYRGSVEEMDDLHGWLVTHQPSMVTEFCLWCHKRRTQVDSASPGGIDIRVQRSIQYDVQRLN